MRIVESTAEREIAADVMRWTAGMLRAKVSRWGKPASSEKKMARCQEKEQLTRDKS